MRGEGLLRRGLNSSHCQSTTCVTGLFFEMARVMRVKSTTSALHTRMCSERCVVRVQCACSHSTRITRTLCSTCVLSRARGRARYAPYSIRQAECPLLHTLYMSCCRHFLCAWRSHADGHTYYTRTTHVVQTWCRHVLCAWRSRAHGPGPVCQITDPLLRVIGTGMTRFTSRSHQPNVRSP